MDDDQQDQDAPPSGSSMGIVLVGLAIGLLIAGAVIVLGNRSDDSTASTPLITSAPDESTTSVDRSEIAEQNGDAADLVVAYGRSRTDDHALSGNLIRLGSSPVAVRRAIMGGRAIDESGVTAAVTEAGETRQCELLEGQWLCAPPLPAIPLDIDVQGFATLLLTEQPTYSVFATSTEPPDALASIGNLGAVTCWSMVSGGRVDRARFGAETTMCFHDDIGALVGRVTETSAGDNLFIATSLTADVSVADVEPSR